MKQIFIISLFIISSQINYAQCTANQHNISNGPPFVSGTLGAGHHANTDFAEENLCDGRWILILSDDFNGNKIDGSIWRTGFPGLDNYNISTDFNSGTNYSVHDGVLDMTSTLDLATGKTVVPSMQTWREFPAGRVQVRAKFPEQPGEVKGLAPATDLAPLWLEKQLDYHLAATSNSFNQQYFWNEMDVEFMGDASHNKGEYTLIQGWSTYSGTRYMDGASGSSCLDYNLNDNNWHIYERH